MDYLVDTVGIGGAAAIVGGIYMMHAPSSLIVAGLMCLAFAIMYSRKAS